MNRISWGERVTEWQFHINHLNKWIHAKQSTKLNQVHLHKKLCATDDRRAEKHNNNKYGEWMKKQSRENEASMDATNMIKRTHKKVALFTLTLQFSFCNRLCFIAFAFGVLFLLNKKNNFWSKESTKQRINKNKIHNEPSTIITKRFLYLQNIARTTKYIKH